MAWLFFAFSGPVLWAISTHFDKYLVERYFKHNDVAVLRVPGLPATQSLPATAGPIWCQCWVPRRPVHGPPRYAVFGP